MIKLISKIQSIFKNDVEVNDTETQQRRDIRACHNQTTPSMLQALEARQMYDAALGVELAEVFTQQSITQTVDADFIDQAAPNDVTQNNAETAFMQDQLGSHLSIEIPNIATNFEYNIDDAGIPENYYSFDKSLVKEILFIDSSIDNYAELIEGVDLQKLISGELEVVVLDNDNSGIDQIGNYLSQYNNQLEAVHIVSHGDVAQLELGSDTLSNTNLSEHLDALAAWGASFAVGADILFYGCNVADGAVGQKFVQDLHDIIETDIAASTDLTGNAGLGGDWELEVHEGEVTAQLVFNSPTTTNFAGILAVITVTNTTDIVNAPTGAGTTISDLLTNNGGDGISLREAIIAANNTAGADTIEFAVGGTITVSSGFNAITEELTIDGSTAPGYVEGTPTIKLTSVGSIGYTQLLSADGVNNITIEGLRFNVQTSTAGSTNGNFFDTNKPTQLRISNSTGTKILNNVFDGTGYSTADLFFRNVTDFSFSGNEVFSFQGRALMLIDNLYNVEVTDNIIRNNTVDSIFISPSVNSYGVISGNQLYSTNYAGIYLGTPYNTYFDITNNSFYNNGTSEIDLEPLRITGAFGRDSNDLNDVDNGGNLMQNYPVITSATAFLNDLTVSGTLNSESGQDYRIDIYASNSLVQAEAQFFLGSTYVTTDTVSPYDTSFVFNYNNLTSVFGQGLSTSQISITATATRISNLPNPQMSGATSEISLSTLVTPVTLKVTTVLDELDGDTSSIGNLLSNPGGTGVSLREAIIAANNTPGHDLIEFDFDAADDLADSNPGDGAYTITLTQGIIYINDQLTIDGTSVAGYIAPTSIATALSNLGVTNPLVDRIDPNELGVTLDVGATYTEGDANSNIKVKIDFNEGGSNGIIIDSGASGSILEGLHYLNKANVSAVFLQLQADDITIRDSFFDDSNSPGGNRGILTNGSFDNFVITNNIFKSVGTGGVGLVGSGHLFEFNTFINSNSSNDLTVQADSGNANNIFYNDFQSSSTTAILTTGSGSDVNIIGNYIEDHRGGANIAGTMTVNILDNKINLSNLAIVKVGLNLQNSSPSYVVNNAIIGGTFTTGINETTNNYISGNYIYNVVDPITYNSTIVANDLNDLTLPLNNPIITETYSVSTGVYEIHSTLDLATTDEGRYQVEIFADDSLTNPQARIFLGSVILDNSNSNLVSATGVFDREFIYTTPDLSSYGLSLANVRFSVTVIDLVANQTSQLFTYNSSPNSPYFVIVTTENDVDDAQIVYGGTNYTIADLLANPGADGHISFREALYATENTAGFNEIRFAALGGPIVLNTALDPLPYITQQLRIDGTQTPGYVAPSTVANAKAALGVSDPTTDRINADELGNSINVGATFTEAQAIANIPITIDFNGSFDFHFDFYGAATQGSSIEGIHFTGVGDYVVQSDAGQLVIENNYFSNPESGASYFYFDTAADDIIVRNNLFTNISGVSANIGGGSSSILDSTDNSIYEFNTVLNYDYAFGPTGTGTIISYNYIDANVTAIIEYASDNTYIVGNHIVSTSGNMASAILLRGDTGATGEQVFVYDNKISDSTRAIEVRDLTPVIAYNSITNNDTGIYKFASENVFLSENLIYDNTDALSLFGTSFQTNDADDLNAVQNYAQITNVTLLSNGFYRITGTLDAATTDFNRYKIDFYIDNSSGSQARVLVGSQILNNSNSSLASGVGSVDDFSFTFDTADISALVNNFTDFRFTAITSDTVGLKSSEIFLGTQIFAPPVTIVVDTVNDLDDAQVFYGGTNYSAFDLITNKGADGLISLREALIATNNTPLNDVFIQFSVSGTITLASALPTITNAVSIDGTTAPGYVAPNSVASAYAALGVSNPTTDRVDSSEIGSSLSVGATYTLLDAQNIPIKINVNGVTDYGLYFNDVFNNGAIDYSVIKGIEIYNANLSPITISRGENFQIRDNYLHDNINTSSSQSTGVTQLTGSSNNLISNNYIADTGRSGMRSVGTTFTTMEFNTIDNVTEGVATLTGYNIYYNIFNTTGTGVQDFNGSSNNIIGNQITNTGSYAILSSGSAKFIADNNISGSTYGINRSGSSNNSLIQNNSVYDNTYGIYSTGNIRLSENLVYNNSFSNIDMPPFGATANDPDDVDSGTNPQNTPIITDVILLSSGIYQIEGYLDSETITNDRYLIEIFADDQTSNIGAKKFIGNLLLNTGNSSLQTGIGSVQDWYFNFTTSDLSSLGLNLADIRFSATATDDVVPQTSELFTFSSAPSLPTYLVVNTVNDVDDAQVLYGGTNYTIADLISNSGADGLISLREAIIATNNTSGANEIRFNINGTIVLASALPAITDELFIDGTSDPDYVAPVSAATALANLGVTDPLTDRLNPLEIGNTLDVGATFDSTQASTNIDVKINFNNVASNGFTFNSGSSNSIVKGLELFNSRGAAIQINSGVNNIEISDNYIHNINAGLFGNGVNSAIYVNQGSDAHLISNNLITNGASGTWANAIFLNSITTDRPENVVIQFNTINNFNSTSDAIWGTQGTQVLYNEVSNSGGIYVIFDGGIIIGNQVYNTNDRFGQAIVVAGNRDFGGGFANHYVADNHVYDGLSSTFGIVFNQTDPGTIITNNAVHNMTADGIVGVQGTLTAYGFAEISQNIIYDNDGLAIELVSGIVSSPTSIDQLPLVNDTNDADIGANNSQNYPVLSSATKITANDLLIFGRLNSEAGKTYRIEFYADDNALDPEAKYYLGSIIVNTDNSLPTYDANFSFVYNGDLTNLNYISATATDITAQTTSELSAAIGLGTDIYVTTLIDEDDTSGGTNFANIASGNGISLREAIHAANNLSDLNQIKFVVSGDIVLTSQLPTITETLIIDGSTSPSYVTPAGLPGGFDIEAYLAANPTLQDRIDNFNNTYTAGSTVDPNTFAGINIDSSAVNADVFTFTGNSDGSTLKGLEISDFTNSAIRITDNVDGIIISENYIHTSNTLGGRDFGIYTEDNSNYHIVQNNYFSGGDTSISFGNTVIGQGVSNSNLVAFNTIESITDQRHGYFAGSNSTDNIFYYNYITSSGTLNANLARVVIASGNEVFGNLLEDITSLALSIEGDDNYLYKNSFDNTNGVIVGTFAAVNNNTIDNNIFTNNSDGIRIGSTSTGNTLTQNLFTNQTGLPIDLNDNNILDTVNLPVLTSATAYTNNVLVVNSNLSNLLDGNYNIEFFAAQTGAGPAAVFLGSANINKGPTNLISSYQYNGLNTSFTEIRATVTNTVTGQTYEISLPVSVLSAASAGYNVDNLSDDTTPITGAAVDGDYTLGNLTLREAIELANANAGSEQIRFSLLDNADDSNDVDGFDNKFTIDLSQPLPVITDTVDINGTTALGYSFTDPRVTDADDILLETPSDLNAVVIIRSDATDGSNLILGAGSDNSIIRGLRLENASSIAGASGIDVQAGVDGVTIEQNYFLLLDDPTNTGIDRAAINITFDGIGSDSHIIQDNIIFGASGLNDTGIDGIRWDGGSDGATNSHVLTISHNTITGVTDNAIESSNPINSTANLTISENYLDISGGNNAIELTSANGQGSITNNQLLDDGIQSGTGGDGVVITSNGPVDSYYSVSNNQYSNIGGTLIDLGNDGITSNDTADVDSGPNSLQNYPIIATAYQSGTNFLQINADLSSLPSTDYIVQFYAEDASGNVWYIGTSNINSNPAVSNNMLYTYTGDNTNIARIGAIASSVIGPLTTTSEFSPFVDVLPLPVASSNAQLQNQLLSQLANANMNGAIPSQLLLSIIQSNQFVYSSDIVDAVGAVRLGEIIQQQYDNNFRIYHANDDVSSADVQSFGGNNFVGMQFGDSYSLANLSSVNNLLANQTTQSTQNLTGPNNAFFAPVSASSAGAGNNTFGSTLFISSLFGSAMNSTFNVFQIFGDMSLQVVDANPAIATGASVIGFGVGFSYVTAGRVYQSMAMAGINQASSTITFANLAHFIRGKAGNDENYRKLKKKSFVSPISFNMNFFANAFTSQDFNQEQDSELSDSHDCLLDHVVTSLR